MLGKLLKYDLKWIYKVLIIFYILAIIFAIFARIFFSVDNSILFEVLGGISAGFAISMIVSSLINTVMRSWVRFIRNVYKDESYLTHTLPVSKSSIYMSKVLSSIICSFTTILVILLSLFICYYSKENMEALKGSFALAASAYDTTIINIILIVSLVVFLELVFVLLVGQAGIILGHKSNERKLAKSVIFGFLLYLGNQGLTLLIIYIIGLFNDGVMNLFNTTDVLNIDTIKIVMSIGIVIYFIYDVMYYIVNKKLLDKGVDVD